MRAGLFVSRFSRTSPSAICRHCLAAPAGGLPVRRLRPAQLPDRHVGEKLQEAYEQLGPEAARNSRRPGTARYEPACADDIPRHARPSFDDEVSTTGAGGPAASMSKSAAVWCGPVSVWRR